MYSVIVFFILKISNDSNVKIAKVYYEDEFEELKNKNQEIKLDEDFKANLKIKLDEEISRQEEKLNRKPNINLLPRKLIPVTACLFVLLATCCTFADEIESLVKGVFSNIDTTVEEAISKGNYQKIDMEYVEHDGISIKVDYIIQEDNNTYIAFNVMCDSELDKIYLTEFKLINTKNILYHSDKLDFFEIDKKFSNNNKIVVYKFVNCNDNIKQIIVEKVCIENKNKKETFDNKWSIEI